MLNKKLFWEYVSCSHKIKWIGFLKAFSALQKARKPGIKLRPEALVLNDEIQNSGAFAAKD